MILNILWVSISAFNMVHHFQSKVIVALVIKGKSRICCQSVITGVRGWKLGLSASVLAQPMTPL